MKDPTRSKNPTKPGNTNIITMKKYIFVVGLLFPLFGLTQQINGSVSNQVGEALIGASVHWLDSNIGVITNEFGEFQIPYNAHSNQKLIASYTGYEADTIEIGNQFTIQFILSDSKTLLEVVVQGKQEGVIISNLSPVKTEQITQTELKKAACCDLAGCFETQSSVQPQTTNVLTNSKELRILGLSGVYNQVLLDGLPMIQGLSYTYGISSIPGTLVENIYISKGANSVVQGFESISGQINVETKEPDNTDRLLLNIYLNNFLEKHFNANYSIKKGKWSNLTTMHSVQSANKIDRDEDHFLDIPLLTRYSISNKWKYGSGNDWGWNSRIGIRLLREKRIGGQINFNENKDEGSSKVYGQSVHLTQPEIWTKTSYVFNDDHVIQIFASSFLHRQNSFFGTVQYQANQVNFYGNIQYEVDYKKHQLKTGISHRHLNLNEHISFTENLLSRTFAGAYNRLESITGFFAENTWRSFDNNWTWIIGLRADHHQQFGFNFTPRTLLKYDFSPKTTIRANFGTGWRTVNLFSENIGLLVSSRDIVFLDQLEPEKAINYGLNFTHKFESNNDLFSGYLSADFYRTDFQNQIFPDYDSDPTKAFVNNFKGTSVSNGFQLELQLSIWQRLEFKTGYNYLDVYRMNGEVKQILPFNSKHKVISTFSYKPINNQYHFDMNVHWHDKQRLPNTKSNPIEFQRPDFSRPYTLVNAQFTYNYKKFELYIGCENIFNFRQNRPIISWQDPFSPYFDTSSVWGPTRGRELYLGFRYRIAAR